MTLNTSKSASIKSRRQTVARLRLRGLTQRDIMDALNQQAIRDALANGIPANQAEQWSLGTINRDIKAIEAEWVRQAVRDTGEHKARVLAELDEVLREAWKVNDLKHILSVLAQVRALLGLDAPAKQEISGKDGGPVQTMVLNIDYSQLSDEQLKRIADGEDPRRVVTGQSASDA